MVGEAARTEGARGRTGRGRPDIKRLRKRIRVSGSALPVITEVLCPEGEGSRTAAFHGRLDGQNDEGGNSDSGAFEQDGGRQRH